MFSIFFFRINRFIFPKENNKNAIVEATNQNGGKKPFSKIDVSAPCLSFEGRRRKPMGLERMGQWVKGKWVRADGSVMSQQREEHEEKADGFEVERRCRLWEMKMMRFKVRKGMWRVSKWWKWSISEERKLKCFRFVNASERRDAMGLTVRVLEWEWCCGGGEGDDRGF